MCVRLHIKAKGNEANRNAKKANVSCQLCDVCIGGTRDPMHNWHERTYALTQKCLPRPDLTAQVCRRLYDTDTQPDLRRFYDNPWIRCWTLQRPLYMSVRTHIDRKSGQSAQKYKKVKRLVPTMRWLHRQHTRPYAHSTWKDLCPLIHVAATDFQDRLGASSRRDGYATRALKLSSSPHTGTRGPTRPVCRPCTATPHRANTSPPHK